MAKGNQEKALKTPQSTRKKISNMSKNVLAAELEEHRANEAKYHSTISEQQELKKEVSELKDSLNELKSSKETNYNPQTNLEERLTEIERRMSEQEQYSRRECIELVGLPSNINGEELENAVIKTFQVAGINIGRQNFHAVHRLADQRVVIAKLTNRRDAIDILRQKKKLRTLSAENQRKMNCQKVYVNESLCPKYRQLLGKCNALFKRGECIGFYTINGKIKVKINEDQTKIIGHNEDLIQHFGNAAMQAIEEERDPRR